MSRPPYIWMQQPRPRPKWLILAGMAALGYALLLYLLSDQSEMSESAFVGRMHYWLAGAGIAVGSLFIAAVWLAGPAQLNRRALGALLVVGLAARIIISAQPMLLEADYWRYLWDGAVVAHGYSPYTHAPSAVLHAAPEVPRELFDLGRRADPVLENIHHGHLTTIYPPVAQGAFAAAWWLRPFDPDGLRIIFFLFDIGAVLLLLRFLHLLALPSAWVAWYWLNPLVLREVYSAGHMDVLVVPLVLGALMLAGHRRPALAGGLLALAAGAKVWPLLLLPLVAGRPSPRSLRFAAATGAFLVLSALIWAPVISSGLHERSGFTAYAGAWQANDGAFRLLLEALYIISAQWPALADAAPTLARGVIGVILAVWMLWWSWSGKTPPADPFELLRRAGLIVAGLFLLSPTQFPWYYLWLLPFLVIRPRLSLLLYSALLPLFYIHYERIDVLWLLHGPIWALLLLELVFRWGCQDEPRNQLLPPECPA